MPDGPDPNLLKGNLDLILLAILEGEPKYGLEIIGEAQDRTNGYFSFREGSLYPALHRLAAQGLVVGEFRDGGRGPRRKYYALTERGRRVLGEKREAFERFSRAVGTLWGTRAPA